jgi:hypothetical protein
MEDLFIPELSDEYEFGGQMTDKDLIGRFILSGNATFSLKDVRTGRHVTYKVQAAKSSNKRVSGDVSHFVSYKHGPSTGDFAYLGCIFIKDRQFKVTRRSKAKKGSTVAIWFDHLMKHLQRYPTYPLPADKIEFWHEGLCGRCGRQLTDPESIATGLGPICRERE